MRLTFTQDAIVQIGNAEGVTSHEHRSGETVDLPDDVAAIFLAQGSAIPAPKVERATKPAGKTASKE